MPRKRPPFQAEEMKDELSLMDDTSREGDETVRLRLEKFRLAADLFDQAGACAAAVKMTLLFYLRKRG